jgi:hypothetical protein
MNPKEQSQTENLTARFPRLAESTHESHEVSRRKPQNNKPPIVATTIGNQNLASILSFSLVKMSYRIGNPMRFSTVCIERVSGFIIFDARCLGMYGTKEQAQESQQRHVEQIQSQM